MNDLELTLKRLFLSERGEVGEGETAEPTSDAAPEQEAQGTGESEPVSQEGTDVTQADQTPSEEHFLTGEENLDPRKLDPALQPIFKRMQGVYTKRMQDIAEIRDRAAEVDRFYNDQAFAQQAVLQWASQNGYTITPPGGQQQQQQPQQAEVPAYLIEAFKNNLAPELQWLAEPQAKAMWTAMQGMLQPVLSRQEEAAKLEQQRTMQARETEWQKHAETLAETAPGWEDHEDVMGELFDFLKGDELHHPTYGSKLQMLYDLATARAASLKQAQQRVANAGKNRVTSGRPVSRTGNVEEDVLKASTQDAWKLARQHALSQFKKQA